MCLVRDVMTRPIIHAAPSDTLGEVARRMSKHSIGGVPVLDQGHLVGLLSKTDVLDLIADETWEPARPVRDAMDPRVLTLSSSSTLAEAALRMGCEGSHRAVVVDDAGCVEGIVTTWDIARSLARSPPFEAS